MVLLILNQIIMVVIFPQKEAPIIEKGKKKLKPKTEKITIEKPSRKRKPQGKREQLTGNLMASREKRQLTKEELEEAIKKGGTLGEARKILSVGNDVLWRYFREYDISYRNRRLTVRDEDGKVCAGPCGQYKKYEEYNKNKSMADGHESRCRECSNEYRRARRAAKKVKC